MFDRDKMIREIAEASDWLQERLGDFDARVAIILGTGLGALVKDLEIQHEFDYEHIPHFPLSTVECHQGRLLAGRLRGIPVLVMQGRFHYYEGYSMQQITFPVRVLKRLGVDYLLVSNACGCVNPQYRKGELMVIEDHVNLLGDNPLIGPNLDDFGPRFPDMSAAYDRELIAIAEEEALRLRIPLQKGVYTAVAGPNLETRAEYRFLRIIGSDVVGMSTVPECIIARHAGIRVCGFSVITDECFPEALVPVSEEEIVAVANGAEPHLTSLVTAVVSRVAAL